MIFMVKWPAAAAAAQLGRRVHWVFESAVAELCPAPVMWLVLLRAAALWAQREWDDWERDSSAMGLFDEVAA